MIHAIKVEFAKTRRLRIWLPLLAILAVQVLWALWALLRWKQRDFSQGWMYFLYQFPLLNCIMMPVAISMVASRLADAEHKANTLRLLCTMQSSGRLFDAKFLCGASNILLVSLLQVLSIFLIGLACSFGAVPWRKLGLFFLSGFLVCLTLYLLHQMLSLLFANQLVSVLVGLGGGFVGLMTMFFPAGVQKLVLWAYFGVLTTTAMDWNRQTRVTSFYWGAFDWASLLLLLGVFTAMYLAGRALFARKEW